MKPRIAISIGDLNGVGIEIALKSHTEISKICTPVYCINPTLLLMACKLLGIEVPNDIELSDVAGEFPITPSKVDVASGQYSFDSFLHAIELAKNKQVDAIVTLPIHKEAWMKAGIDFKGHTDYLRFAFDKEAIMMLGCKKMFVALYTEHIPLRDVAKQIETQRLLRFFLDFHSSIGDNKVAVLGLNPHAGDNGVLGDEERVIEEAITLANAKIGKEIFIGAIVPDVAFTPRFRENFTYFIAMYHDQGLAPLKALYFDESVNISLNLPIIRTSVDHGTAFDIAYKHKANTLSYKNAVESAISLIKN
ncbi:MAG: 4-hydroxythreonine-4-phosphate dehydrogenase [Sulfurimonadaceae bacterium]|jgi:4-hydroxythreonine-4-phosphate dehydrogenase|nr:4-hydroxythreonine-4-phosphate dehydrogenase [Sulfurimonadaceae bacterium]